MGSFLRSDRAVIRGQWSVFRRRTDGETERNDWGATGPAEASRGTAESNKIDAWWRFLPSLRFLCLLARPAGRDDVAAAGGAECGFAEEDCDSAAGDGDGVFDVCGAGVSDSVGMGGAGVCDWRGALAWPLLLTTRLERQGEAIMMKRSSAFLDGAAGSGGDSFSGARAISTRF